jgi:hypothetical protein
VRGRGGLPQARGRIEGQVKQQRLQLAEQAAMQQAAVQVARQKHPLAWISQPQQGPLEQAAGAVHPIPTTLGPQQAGRGGLAGRHGPFGFQGTTNLWQFGQVPAGRGAPQQGR